MIDNFAHFASEQVNRRGEGCPIDDLFDEWRVLNPPAEDWLAIRASLRDMESGETVTVHGLVMRGGPPHAGTARGVAAQ